MKPGVFILLFSLFLNKVNCQDFYPQNFAVENGFITKLLQSNDTLFGTGEFYNGGYEIGSLIRYIGDNRSELDGSMPYIDNGSISAVESDGNGGWYLGIGGSITLNGIVRRGVIHIDENNQTDEDFILMQSTAFGGSIRALLLHNGILYVGGVFNGYAGAEQSQLLAYNTATGEILQTWNTGMVYSSTQFVSSLAIHQNNLIVGGVLLSFSGQPINHLGVFSLSDGSLINNYDASAEVKKIIVDADTAYVSGDFSNILGQNRNYFAKINLSDHSLLPLSVNFNSSVYDFTINENDVYAGGWFTSVNGVSRTGLVKINKHSGEVLTEFNVQLDQPRVECLDIVNDNLIFGGNFMQVNSTAREKLAQVNKDNGLLSTWNSSVASIPEGIENIDGDLVVFGDLNQLQRGVRYSFFALKLPERTLLPIGFTTTSFSLTFRDMVKLGNKIYFASGFNYQINGTSTGLLFSYDLLTQEIESIADIGGISNATVDRLLIHEGKLYISGYFLQVDGQSRNRIARINLSDNSLDDWNPAPEYSFAARKMIVHNEKLFVAGSINQIMLNEEYVVCALNLSDASWAGGLSSDPDIEQAYSGTDLYIVDNTLFLSGYQRMSFTPLVLSAVLKMNEQFEIDFNYVAPMAENAVGASSLGMINGVLFAMHRVSTDFRKIYFHSPLTGDTLLNLPVFFERNAPFSQLLNVPESYIFNSNLLYVGGNWEKINGNSIQGLAIIDGRDVPFPDLSLNSAPLVSENVTSWMAYPNPLKNQFQLQGINHPTHVQLLDSGGRLLNEWEITSNSTITVGDLSAGIYFLYLNDHQSRSCLRLAIQP